IKPFIKPVRFYARKGLTGITGNIYAGLHEFNDMAFLLLFLRPDDLFYDIGSNVGSYTLLASGVCGAKSITLEPVRSTFDILQKNIELNGLQEKVALINAGAGSAGGEIAFTAGSDTTNHVIADGEQVNEEIVHIPLVAVDSLQPGNPALIKIDVEGYETEVLKGMAATLENPSLQAIIIELNGSGERYGYDESKIHELLLSKKFKPYTYSPFDRTLAELPELGNFNTIYCRDLQAVKRRLREAKKIKVMGETL
ncbi:MAG: FkbM family methyltransferase, partial [Bacteroidetes bacterium]|nr:FkbM family methyltransferase [Bacteroidota bacterium]